MYEITNLQTIWMAVILIVTPITWFLWSIYTNNNRTLNPLIDTWIAIPVFWTALLVWPVWYLLQMLVRIT